ncbi:MAG: flagellar biosynthetic protein FliQ [Planctomycetota bacterium]|jgi:flagellar biosynthetic protein FliQ
MDAETVIRIGQEALLLTLLLSAPPVVAAMVVGLLISLFQAATQIQEQTLTVVPKIVAVYVVLVAFGLWAVGQMVSFSLQLLESIGDVGR